MECVEAGCGVERKDAARDHEHRDAGPEPVRVCERDEKFGPLGLDARAPQAASEPCSECRGVTVVRGTQAGVWLPRYEIPKG